MTELYPESRNGFKEQLFHSPDSRYREAPFWAWNCELDREELIEQIGIFHEMGMGGFFPHSRTGMATEYLSDEFMNLVKTCVKTAEERGMLCYLYDEDRWPSGSAGGLVTRECRYRARAMLISPEPLEGFETSRDAFEKKEGEHTPGEPCTLRGYYIASFRIQLCDGYLERYEALSDPKARGDGIWHAYLTLAEETPWHNGQTYIDTLNKAAVDRFKELTYDRYAETLGNEFGRLVPAIFTDEPQFTRKDSLPFPESREELRLTYTNDFDDTFHAKYKYHILEKLPELVWNRRDGVLSQARYHYHDHVCDRFVEAFSDNLGQWCEQHGIMLTGHTFWEDTLFLQTKAVGETMRFYRGFQLPGIDMLRDDHYFTTLKQCQSVARQRGRPGIMSELYGVTNWHFDFKGYKVQGDWQAALGVTLRVPHLSWMSMEGEAKRDFPSSFGRQSPWYKEYRLVSDHFARLNTVLTRGTPDVRIGVIHPIESYWLCWGVNSQQTDLREQLECEYESFSQWMLFGMMEYDFISESMMGDENPAVEGGVPKFRVGRMAYEAVIVPGCITLRMHTIERLQAFCALGGRVIFMGRTPSHADGLPSGEAAKLAQQAECIPFEQHALMEALKEQRFLDARLVERDRPDDYRIFYRDIFPGSRINYLLHQERRDGAEKWVFISHAYRTDHDTEWPDLVEFSFEGCWQVALYDTLTGEKHPQACEYRSGKTFIRQEVYAQDSFLLRLAPLVGEPPGPAVRPVLRRTAAAVLSEAAVSFEEDNVYLLDQAEWSLNGEPWQPREQILKLDTLIRERLGWPVRSYKTVKQPWARKEERLGQYPLALRYSIRAEAACPAEMAMERPEEAALFLNGRRIEAIQRDWYVDKAIRRFPLGAIMPGENTLELRLPYSIHTNLESLYLLGSFRVALQGDRAVMTDTGAPCRLGDLTYQGYPFYSGNVLYDFRLELTGPEKKYELFLPRYAGHLAAAWMDGRRLAQLAFAPQRVPLGTLAAGTYSLCVKVFGNRYNTFGQLHLANVPWSYWGPDSWRTKGSNWQQPYRVREAGLLAYPRILEIDGGDNQRCK